MIIGFLGWIRNKDLLEKVSPFVLEWKILQGIMVQYCFGGLLIYLKKFSNLYVTIVGVLIIL